MRRRLSVVAATMMLLGCVQPRYAYAPVITTSGELAGAPAAVYEVPSNPPRGDVRLSMIGIESLRPTGLSDASVRAIHVALAVSNRSDEPWTFDAAEARLSLTTHPDVPEIEAATAAVTRPGNMEVAARSSRTIDLYFPLPMQLRRESEIPAFEVLWTVHTGATTFTHRTPFQRFVEEPPPPPPPPPSARGDLVPDDLHETDTLLPGSEPPDRRHLVPIDSR